MIAVVSASALVAIVLLVLLVLTACGSNGKLAKILWRGTVLLVIPVLAGAAVVTEKTKYGDNTSSVVLLEDLDLESNDALKEYIAAVAAYQPPGKQDDDPSLAKARSLGEVHAMLNKTISAETEISNDQIWSFCGAGWSIRAMALYAGEGELDNAATIREKFQYLENKTVPLQVDRIFGPFEDFPYHPELPDALKFYIRNGVPPCYGLAVDVESLREAVDAKDLCKVVTTAKGCAPGWKAEFISEGLLCRAFTLCKKDLPKSVKVWEEKLKAVKTEVPLSDTVLINPFPFPFQYTLPQGWNELEALKDSTKERWAADATEAMMRSLLVYHAMSFTFLLIGAVGWVFLLIGSLAGFTASEPKGDDIEP
jgi:hypothetical protein